MREAAALSAREAETPVYFRKTSLVDYPEKIAAAIFFPACNLRCPWCHNGGLISPAGPAALTPLARALAHIEKRAGILGGVVLSGGEPTLFSGLAALTAAIRRIGLPVKLDTNGTMPARLAALLDGKDRPDYIALDLKLAPRRYGSLRPETGAGEEDAALSTALLESVRLVRAAFEAGQIQAEFRSLVFPGGELSPRDIDELAPLTGAVPWHFRPFRPGSCLDPAWNRLAETRPEDVSALAAYAQSVRS